MRTARISPPFFRVGLHNFKFFFGEFPRLIQNNVGIAIFPTSWSAAALEIMPISCSFRAIFRIAVHDVLQQHFGNVRMRRTCCPDSTLLCSITKKVHPPICLWIFCRLADCSSTVRSRCSRFWLRFHGVMYPAADHMGFKGFGHNINSTQIKSPALHHPKNPGW